MASPGVDRRAASSLGNSGDVADAYHAFGNWPVLGAPATPPVRVQGMTMQRFDNAVITLPDGGGPEDAELAPVPLYLRAAGYFPETPFLPRSLPVYPMEAPPVIRHGDATQPYLFVTVDDCWDPEMTSRALDIARDERIKITFFPVGTVLRQNPDLWRRAIVEGTRSRTTPIRICRCRSSPMAGSAGAGRGRPSAQCHARLRVPAALHAAAGRCGDPRRPEPAGAAFAGGRASHRHVDGRFQGLALPRDGGARAQDFVLGNLTEKLQPGAVLLLHALASDIAALPRLAREIHSAGLQSVNLRDQLHLPGQEIGNDNHLSTCPETLPDAAEWC